MSKYTDKRKARRKAARRSRDAAACDPPAEPPAGTMPPHVRARIEANWSALCGRTGIMFEEPCGPDGCVICRAPPLTRYAFECAFCHRVEYSSGAIEDHLARSHCYWPRDGLYTIKYERPLQVQAACGHTVSVQCALAVDGEGQAAAFRADMKELGHCG